MAEITAIAWTDHTFNPWWGCTKIEGPNGTGSACDHCYAATFAKRTGNDVWGKDNARRFFGDKHWNEPLKWNRMAEAEGRRHKVFCASMADVFEARDDLDEHRARLFDLIEVTPWLDWQLLTKRPEQMVRRAPKSWRDGWPANVWAGTTVEDEERAAIRVPRLLAVPAKVRFLSCEPLLGRLRLGPWCGRIPARLRSDGHGFIPEYDPEPRIDWVICGGESGPGHRPLDLPHARTLRDNCRMFGIAFFFKQVGGQYPTSGGDQLDGVTHKEFPSGMAAVHG